MADDFIRADPLAEFDSVALSVEGERVVADAEDFLLEAVEQQDIDVLEAANAPPTRPEDTSMSSRLGEIAQKGINGSYWIMFFGVGTISVAGYRYLRNRKNT